MYILGVDPGVGGALALFDPGTQELIIHDMPTVAAARGVSGAARDIDGYQLGNLMDTLSRQISRAYVEQVGGIGKQSAAKSFQFGLNTGVLHGVLYANLVPMQLVLPQRWKAHFNLKRGQAMSDSAYKSLSRAKASALLPQYSGLWALAKHDGRAEAALIAVYGSTL